MRTIKEIKKGITDAFMADVNIRKKYGITGDSSFDDTFSQVSIESIIFFVVASAMYVIEALFEQFRKDVDDTIATGIIASIPWYHKISLEYQHGDELVFDEATMQYRYPVTDESKRLVKFASCRDAGGGIDILVSGAGDDGLPEALSTDVQTAFKQYLILRKPAGIIVNVRSLDPDLVHVAMQVQYDPLVMNPDGSLISAPSVFPVEDAIADYLKGIVYGGVLNKTRLTDAVQTAAGVEDLVLASVSAKSAVDTEFTEVVKNSYTAVGGAFKADDLRNSISYVLQL